MRKAFDLGKEGAIGVSQFASLVNEMRNEDRELAVTPFNWINQDGRMVCPEFGMKEVGGKNGYLQICGDAVADQETRGALMMMSQFEKGADLAIQLMPDLKGVYDEGRFVLGVRDGVNVRLYGGNIVEGKQVVEMAVRVGEWSENPLETLQSREVFQERVRGHSFSFRNLERDKIWEWLIESMPNLAQTLQKIKEGKVEGEYKELKEKAEGVVKEVEGQIGKSKCVREVDLIRIGAYAERRLAQVSGYALALSSGCGVSNREIVNNWGVQNMFGGTVGLNGVFESVLVWQKPPERWVWKENEESGWRRVREVKIEKCGYHWENGGSCTWRPNDYVEVGSKCPKCGKVFICG